MLVVEIEDIKRFMGELLLENSFDNLVLVQAEIRMTVTYMVDGRINRAFLNSDEEEACGEFIGWGQVRAQIMNMIKGKRLPVKMKLMLKKRDNSEADSSLIILFENSILRLMTNVTGRSFSLERPDSSEWDNEVISALKKLQIAYRSVND